MSPKDKASAPARDRTLLVGGAIIFLAIAALGSAQIFGEPSYELALAAGLVCPPVAAVVTALGLSRRQLGGFAMLSRALYNGVVLAALAYGVAFVWGAIRGYCDLWSGSVLFALGPGVGTILGAVWGAIASEAARRRRRRKLWATLLALAGPWGSAAFQLWWFYATPTVFAFEPFVGYFNGALWDTTLATSELYSYRAASAATLVAIYVAALHLGRHEGRFAFRSLGRPGLIALGCCAAIASLLSVALGDRLGHWQTASTIAAELGAERSEGRCHVIHDRRLEPAHVARFAKDCEAHVRSLEAYLALTPSVAPIDVYLFRDSEQKRALMGAGRTSIAKPWRREIYVHDAGYPHPIVRHELMHVLAPGRGPFRIAGSLAGWLPNPGLIEGIAEASAPRDDNLDVHQWAAAMRRIEVLPRIAPLLSLSFFANHSATSYLAAGSFVSHIHHTHGPETLRRWYGGEDLPALTGSSWEALEQGWWQMLDGAELSAADLAEAEARFDRPGLFDRRCPHVVDELMGFANARVGSGDVDGALLGYRRVLVLDAGNHNATFGLVRCHERRHDDAQAKALLSALSSDERMTEAVRSRALEELGDMALRAGGVDEARAIYQQVRAAANGEGRLRTLDVKAHYADDALARAALVALLIGDEGEGPDNIDALDRIGRWRAERPEDGTPDYLFARQHLDRNQWELASERLDAALSKSIALPSVETEIWRMRAVVACALGDGASAASALARYADSASASRHAWYAAMVERCSAP